MNKNILVFGGLVVLAAVGIYFAFFQEKPSGSQPAGTTDQPAGAQNQNQSLGQNDDVTDPSGNYTINELLGMNRPMKCKWRESLTQGGEVTNIIYLNGKKFYQDVTMGDMGHAYTVSDGEYIYAWSDFGNMASKMKISELETAAKPEQTETSATMDQKRDFTCENWKADNSVFNPPQGKEFQDVTGEINEAVDDLQQNSEQYQQQACDMCKNAPTAELRDQCLENMQCE